MPNFIKILLAIVVVTVLGFFGATYFIEKSFEKNNKAAFQKWEKETFLSDDYQGTIKNAEDKFGSYRVTIFTFKKEDKELVLCDLFPELKVGDTILKKKGDKNIYYLRNGKNLTLQYKFCY